MNIAYYIIAWNKPLLLKRIIDRLNQSNVYFYIHIDKKTENVGLFQEIFKSYQNVAISSQYEVYWGGFSQVKTQLYLLRLALSSEMNFKYFVMLSGQDYPIKTNKYINDFFTQNSRDFMSYNRIEDLGNSYKNKYKYFHFLDCKYLNPRDPHLNKFLYYIFYGIHRRLGKYLPHRKFYRNFIPYFGSTWHSLTRETVKFVLDFVDTNPDYVQFMKHVEFPSEMFIHNIILNTEARKNLCDIERFDAWIPTKNIGEKFEPEYSSLKYMDWSERGGASKPAVLDISYVETLKANKNLFMRKVDDKISVGLLDYVDIHLLSVDPGE